MTNENETFIEELKRQAEHYGAELSVGYFIDLNHRYHYWYGGDVAEIKYKEYTFSVSAIGDVIANLTDNIGDEIARVKDKGNNGVFYDEMRSYITGDEQLMQFIAEERLIFDYNNWWECFVTLPSGEFIDLMWALDGNKIDEAVKEVLEEMDQVIKNIEGDS